MDKRFWGILIAVIVVLGGVFWLTSGNKAVAPSSSKPTNHVEGQNKYNINLMEYGDFQCPYCGEYYQITKQVVSIYSPYIQFQFRNLPLTQLHPNAFAGARAAEAAGLMGKYWQMHDALYTANLEYYSSNEKLATWINASNPQTYFDQYAQQLGLNVTQFNNKYASTTVNNNINSDVAAFGKTGFQEATPTFILDGKQIQPQPTVSSFESIINAEIKKKGFTPPASTSSSGTTPTASSSPTQSVQKTTSK